MENLRTPFDKHSLVSPEGHSLPVVAPMGAARVCKRQLSLSFSLIALLCFQAARAGAAVPPHTGQNVVNGRDQSYQIISDDTGQSQGPYPIPAYVVPSPLPVGWQPDSWIAPRATQPTDESTPPTYKTTTTVYQMSFVVGSVVGPNPASLFVFVSADDGVLVTLFNSNKPNGATVFFNSNLRHTGLPPPRPAIEYGYGQFALCSSLGGLCTGVLTPGVNTLQFRVLRLVDAAPTGLTVSFLGNLGDQNLVTGANSARPFYFLNVLPDPVDGASGQYYDASDDLLLGGPLDLSFSRYYSSALSVAGFSSALGVNWMSNFDVALSVSGATAKALLFGGKVVQFTGSGGAWQLQSPADIAYQLALSGGVYKLMDPVNRKIYTFNSDGALTRIEDRNGNAITVTPGPFGPTAISDGLGRTLTPTYTNGQLTKVQDQGGRAFVYAYNGNLLVSATDQYNATTNYTYTTSGSLTGLMTAKQLPRGDSPTTQTYDASGRVSSQIDGNNNTTKIAFDGNGGTTITDPLGAVTKQTSDNTGDVTALSDPAGGTANATYGATNRRTGVTDKSGNHTAFTWHAPSGLPASTTDPLGNTTAYSYTAQVQGSLTFYNLTGITYPDGASTALSYDANGNVVSMTTRDGSVTKYAYDSAGRVLTITAPDKGVTSYAWNADSTLASRTDALGNKSAYSYDSVKRLIQITDPNGGVTSFVYDKSGGHMSASTYAAGESDSLTYDANGQPQSWVNGASGTYTYAYSNTERIASVTDPLKNKVSYTYDAADRLASITDPTGVVVSYAYDSANRVTSVSDSSGPRLSYAYTADGYIASASDGSGNKTSYTYDALGRLVGLNTAGGNKYALTYDKLGQLIGTTNPLGETQTLTRDAIGNVTQIAMSGGIATSITPDWRGQPTSITSANGNKWSIAYDAAGRPSQITDPLGNATSFTYTGSQLTQATLPLGTVTVTNDADGRVTKRQFSDNTVINAGFDGNGLLISADNVTIKRDAKDQPTNINGIAITLDGAGRLATLTYAPGKTITYAYNNSGRLTTITDWVGGKTSLTYDGASRLVTLTYPNGVVTTYSYDADGRVIKVAFGALGSISLTRDAAGKITAADRSVPLAPAIANLSAQQYSYDAAGELTSATSDKMGRVTSQGSRTYTWNLASQLTSFHDGTNSATFTYDGRGEINTLTTGSSTRSFVFNYLFPLPALSIVRQGGSDLRYYVYLPDGRLLYSIEANNTRHFYHFDEMGNTVLLSGDGGAVTDSYAITPYGEIADHSGTSDNPFTWQGQYGVYQEGAALYYVRARHYDASAARFISPDPEMSADPRSSEPYVYANGNPLRWVDPLGNDNVLNVLKDAGTGLLNTVIDGLKYLWSGGEWVLQKVEGIVKSGLGTRSGTLATSIPPVHPPDPPPPDPPVWVAPAPLPHREITGLMLCEKLGYCNAKGLISPAGIPVITLSIGKIVSNDGSSIVSNDGASVISNDGSTLVSHDGASLIGHDGSTLIRLVGVDNQDLVRLDIASLVGHDPASLIGHDGRTLVSHDGGSLIRAVGNNVVAIVGSGIVSNDASSLKPRQ